MADSGVESPSFPERLHIGALPMRLSLEHEATVLRWVDWAREQVAHWTDAGDPGEWDARRALTELAEDARTAAAG